MCEESLLGRQEERGRRDADSIIHPRRCELVPRWGAREGLYARPAQADFSEESTSREMEMACVVWLHERETSLYTGCGTS